VFGRADSGRATSAIPIEQEDDSDSEGNPDPFVVQDNLCVRQTAAVDKQSLEADAAVGESIPKRPRRSCMSKLGKNHLF
jgi:hypothetical protein